MKLFVYRSARPGDVTVVDLPRAYTDAGLASAFRHAVPGTGWHRKLSDEIGRRDAQGGQG